MRVILLAMLLAGCAVKNPNGNNTAPELPPTVTINAQTQEFLADLHMRATGHSTLPNRERLLCLLGRVKADTVFVDGFMAPQQTATDTTVQYWPCEDARFIGTLHTHPLTGYGDGCWFSATDVETFMESESEIVMIVSCVKDGQVGLLSKVKRGYSQRAR